MNILLSDIGNTNTRIALADASGLREDTLASHPNANWNNFDEMLEFYLRERSAPRIEACYIAIAGPVKGRTGQLGIHNWNIDAASVERASGARHVELVNDLRALGNALPDLNRFPICGALGELRNGQILVANVGTGFNVCPIRVEGNRASVLESEAGGAHLPGTVRDLLYTEIGDVAAEFRDVGQCFGGRGAAAIARAVAGKDLSHDEVMQSLDGGRAGRIFASALGLLAHSLIFTHLPRHGIVFTGSVARSVLRSPAATAFIEEFWRDGKGSAVDPRNFPVSLIEDDAAGLLGCLRWARESAHK